MPDAAPDPELMRSLGRVVRGLSALFWGLPIALVICVQTALGDWLRPLGILPPLLATGLLLYALSLLGGFQKQERVWHKALDRARIFALLNLGLSPFLYWWNKIQANSFFTSTIELLVVSGLLFLFTLNPMLWRLTAMLPDETLRHETRVFTTLNKFLLAGTILVLALYYVMDTPRVSLVSLSYLQVLKGRVGLWLILFLVLMPMAMTMATLWKIKEAILASVFGGGHGEPV